MNRKITVIKLKIESWLSRENVHCNCASPVLKGVSLICDPFRGHDVRDEDEEYVDDVTGLYLALLLQHTLEESSQQHCVRCLVSPSDLAWVRKRRRRRNIQFQRAWGQICLLGEVNWLGGKLVWREREKSGGRGKRGEGQQGIDHVTAPAITSDMLLCFLLHRNAK